MSTYHYSESSSSNTKRAAGLFFVATAASFLSPASAFTPLSHSVHHHAISTTTTALHLKTGQGNQLVAAFNAANTVKKNVDDDDYDEDVVVMQKAEAAPANPEARSLAARLFSLDFHHRDHHHQKDDVVYYPLVGFKLVHHEGRVIPLPTKSHAACRISTRAQAEEEVYGWYSPSCSLDLYAEDICHEPNQES